MKNLFLLITFLFSQSLWASSFSFECTFSGGEVVKGESKPYDFDDSFQSNFMLTSPFFDGAMPELYVIDGEESDGPSYSQEMNFFVTDKLPLSAYSAVALQLISDLVPAANVKSAQLAFPTDLYASFLLISLEMNDGSYLKQAVAGLDMAVCK